MDPAAASILPDLKQKHELEIGMLVKSADLPRFSADVETKNKYNRKKNVQTAIKYNPVTIERNPPLCDGLPPHSTASCIRQPTRSNFATLRSLWLVTNKYGDSFKHWLDIEKM